MSFKTMAKQSWGAQKNLKVIPIIYIYIHLYSIYIYMYVYIGVYIYIYVCVCLEMIKTLIN